jgi:hypothetical protein
MDFYCVDTDASPTGEHIVHRIKCEYIPADKIELGLFPTCYEAIHAARKHYQKINGCQQCCMECYRTKITRG